MAQMSKRQARNLAKERAINVLHGDVLIGGYAGYLSTQGYSEDDILAAEQIYRELIAKLEEQLHGKRNSDGE